MYMQDAKKNADLASENDASSQDKQSPRSVYIGDDIAIIARFSRTDRQQTAIIVQQPRPTDASWARYIGPS